MWSEEGLRVEIRSVPDNTAMREYTNHHFRSPGEFTTSRLVSGASGKGFKICLEFDPEFRQYTANALKVEVVCCSAGTTTSQCYAIPLSDKHGAFQVRLDKWLRWNHSGAVPERGRTEIAYSLPEPISKFPITMSSELANSDSQIRKKPRARAMIGPAITASPMKAVSWSISYVALSAFCGQGGNVVIEARWYLPHRHSRFREKKCFDRIKADTEL